MNGARRAGWVAIAGRAEMMPFRHHAARAADLPRSTGNGHKSDRVSEKTVTSASGIRLPRVRSSRGIAPEDMRTGGRVVGRARGHDLISAACEHDAVRTKLMFDHSCQFACGVGRGSAFV
jgi:hypothetical protein